MDGCGVSAHAAQRAPHARGSFAAVGRDTGLTMRRLGSPIQYLCSFMYSEKPLARLYFTHDQLASLKLAFRVHYGMS